MKKRESGKGILWLTGLLALLPMGALVLCWRWVPELVPNSWSFDGQVSYGSKWLLWFVAALGPVILLLFQVMPRWDPQGESYTRFWGTYRRFCLLIVLFLDLLMAAVLVETFRPGRLAMGRVTLLLLAMLFCLLGNEMGRVKPNASIGARTPWALADPDVWNRTQRAGGKVLFFSGLVTMPMALLAPEKLAMAVFLTLLASGIGLTFWLSWRWYREGHPEA